MSPPGCSARRRPATRSRSSCPAMAGTTDQLVAWTREASPDADPREYDLVVSSGELVTIGLLAMILQDLGVPARSWTAWQLPIRTDGAHGNARIEGIDSAALEADLRQGRVAIVPGFQGVSPDGRIATLGRGGSDTSAVALAAALNADRCDIFTDVDGVYTCDPRIVAKARKLDRITYEEMLGKRLPGRESAADARRRNGHEASCANPGAVLLRGRSGNAGRGRGRDRGTGNHQRHRLQPRRSEDHRRTGRRQARCRGRHIRAPCRRHDQCRYDRPECVGRRRGDRYHLHRAGRGPSARHRHDRTVARSDRLRAARSRRKCGKGVGPSASACAATPASPSGCSRPCPKRVSTSR